MATELLCNIHYHEFVTPYEKMDNLQVFTKLEFLVWIDEPGSKKPKNCTQVTRAPVYNFCETERFVRT